MFKPSVTSQTIKSTLIGLSNSDLDINALAQLLAKMADDYNQLGQLVAKQEQTIAHLQMQIQSLKPHEHSGE